MGWRGTTRSLIAAGRRIDRANKRAARERAAYLREVAKLEAEAEAEAAVEAFEDLCDELASVHCVIPDPIDWQSLAEAKEPVAPEPSNAKGYKARRALERYKPGLLDRLFNQEAKQCAKLEKAIETGVQADSRASAEAVEAFKKRHAQWMESARVAEGVLASDPTAERLALSEHSDRFSEADFLGRKIEFALEETGWTILLHANPVEDMPQEKLSLLKTRKLSRKAMPKGELMSLHQDNVCGAVIRCAVEFFAIIPKRDAVEVRAILELLDTATGHVEAEPVVIARITRSLLDNVNLGRLDPSDFIESINHQMRFLKTKGFQRLPA